jgi:hypothetical protein
VAILKRLRGGARVVGESVRVRENVCGRGCWGYGERWVWIYDGFSVQEGVQTKRVMGIRERATKTVGGLGEDGY